MKLKNMRSKPIGVRKMARPPRDPKWWAGPRAWRLRRG